jgi:hypothetical protein
MKTNETLVGFTDAIYQGLEDAIGDIYQEDFSQLGYEWPRNEGVAISEWRRATNDVLPGVSALIERHERISALSGHGGSGVPHKGGEP